MRPLLVLFCFLSFSLTEDVQFSLFFRGQSTVNEIGEKVEKLVRMVNGDNQLVSARLEKIDCAEEESNIRELCENVKGEPLLRIREVNGSRVEVEGLINPHDSQIFKEVERLLIKFCNGLFVARSEDDKERNGWEGIPESFMEKISKYSLAGSSGVEQFMAVHSLEHSLLVCYKPDKFQNLAAVFAAINAAEEIKAPIGLLTCENEHGFCCEGHIPKIADLLDGTIYQEYDGLLETEKVADFLRMLRIQAISELNEEIVPRFRSGLLPDFPSRRETTVMLFSPNRTNDAYVLFEKFARKNHGKYHLGVLVDKGVAMWPHHPALITGKPYERVAQATVNWEDLSEEGIRRYITEGVRPSILEKKHGLQHYVVDAKTAHAVFSIGRPILFFFDKTKKTDATSFAKLASNENIRSSLASFAVINGRNIFSLYLADLLNVVELPPSFVLYIPEKNCVYIEQIKHQTEKDLENWLLSNLEEKGGGQPVSIDLDSISNQNLWERQRDIIMQLNAPPTPSFHDEL